MVDPYLASLLDAPLNTAERINRIWLPQGKRPTNQLTEEERLAHAANLRVKTATRSQKATEKRNALLEFYAAGTVPFEKVAQHTGLPIDTVREEMAKRGRAA